MESCYYQLIILISMPIFIYLQDGEAYAYLLNVLAPEFCTPATLDTKDPYERAKLVLDHAERMGCKRYLTPKDIVEGSANLNLAFVAQIFQERYEVNRKIHCAETIWHEHVYLCICQKVSSTSIHKATVTFSYEYIMLCCLLRSITNILPLMRKLGISI